MGTVVDEAATVVSGGVPPVKKRPGEEVPRAGGRLVSLLLLMPEVRAVHPWNSDSLRAWEDVSKAYLRRRTDASR
jgi:hypothetical protein